MKRCILIAVLLCIHASSGYSQSKSLDCDAGLRFLVAQNIVAKAAFTSERRREIWILIDNRSFSENNLTRLFELFRKKYSSPAVMDIRVETSWDRIPVPELDCPINANSGPSNSTEEGHWAIYLRRGPNEIFRFNPSLSSGTIKTVLLRGQPF
jgi:hypothetical protein